tara:strand:+ start:992 stop:1150 length:159 start_codon:yes stop_codon:yes gene_type:complete
MIILKYFRIQTGRFCFSLSFLCQAGRILYLMFQSFDLDKAFSTNVFVIKAKE